MRVWVPLRDGDYITATGLRLQTGRGATGTPKQKTRLQRKCEPLERNTSRELDVHCMQKVKFEYASLVRQFCQQLEQAPEQCLTSGRTVRKSHTRLIEFNNNCTLSPSALQYRFPDETPSHGQRNPCAFRRVHPQKVLPNPLLAGRAACLCHHR